MSLLLVLSGLLQVAFALDSSHHVADGSAANIVEVDQDGVFKSVTSRLMRRESLRRDSNRVGSEVVQLPRHVSADQFAKMVNSWSTQNKLPTVAKTNVKAKDILGLADDSVAYYRQNQARRWHHDKALNSSGSIQSSRTTVAKTYGKARDQLPLVPYPTSVKLLDGGSFLWNSRVQIRADEAIPSDTLALRELRELTQNAPLGKTFKSQLYKRHQSSRFAVIECKLDFSLKASYTLHIEGDRMDIVAADAGGMYYAVQTLRQLLRNSKEMRLQAMHIEDKPVFSWRGLHLDCSRHFFSVAHIRKLLDTVARFKMNRFHWHLTDDQGWRLPVAAYPNLTQAGNAYTADEIRDVVAYASDRNIEIIPEVDVPGHAAAAVAAYPELGNLEFAAPNGPVKDWGMFQWTLSPTNTTKRFLESVLDTLVELFPSKRVHMGGDEAPTLQWSGTSSYAKKQWLQIPDDGSGGVQSLFNQWLGDMLHERGRSMAGWDEMQSMSGLRRDTTVFAWRSSTELDKAVGSGRSAVCCDNGFLYFDYVQGGNTEPKGQPVVTLLQTVYERCNQFAEKWAGEPLVLGAQGQLWSEYIETSQHLQYMAFPRSLALADCLWSHDAGGSFDQFLVRLRPQLESLKADGVNFREL